MRECVVAAILLLAGTQTAAALPPFPAEPERASTLVQVQDGNRFIPRIFRRGEENAPNNADTSLRLDQLEAQVRALTGQVEQLRFELQQLRGGAAAPLAPGAVPGPGAPPRSLGTLPATTAAPGQPAAATAAPPPANTGGPVDLGALNRALSTPPSAAASAPATTATTAPTSVAPATPAAPVQPAPAAPVVDGRLAEAQSLYDTGRYQMAAQSARGVLDQGAAGSLASEARHLQGEALLAQGDLRGAANVFLENYTTDPNGPQAQASLVKLARAFNSLGETEAACSSIEELYGAYPGISSGLRAEAEAERRSAGC